MNVIHSIDGMIVREMNRRCNYDETKLTNILAILRSDTRQRIPLNQCNKTKMVLAAHLEEINKHTIKHMDIEFISRAEQLVLDILASPSFELVCVHDEFKAHANNMDTVRYWYTCLLAELADSHIMQDIIQQITKNPKLVLTRASENLGEKIRQSNYALG